jgi:PAS domain S-box-containing protein
MGINDSSYKFEASDYQRIFENVPDLYLILSPDLKILDCSTEFLKATLTERAQIQGLYLFDVFPDNPDDPNATGASNLRASLNRVLQNKVADAMAVQKYDIKNTEGVFKEKSWSPYNVPVLDNEGNITAIIVKTVDVTTLIEEKEIQIKQSSLIEDLKEQLKTLEIYKRAQQIQDINVSLRESVKAKSEEFESLFNAVPVGIVGINKEGKIKLFNEKACQIFNYDVEEIVNRPISQILHCSNQEMQPELLKLLQSPANENASEKIESYCFGVRNGGKEFPIEISISQSHFDSNTIYLLKFKDVTIQKEAQKQLDTQLKNLEEKNKELEQFTYIASHDLQEPLRSITSLIELFQQEYQGVFDENAQTYFDFVLQSTGRMKELIKGLLDYSRIGKQMIIRKENLNEIMRNVLQDLTNSIEKNKATVTYDELPSLYASGLHLRILFQNLIANSIKFNKPGILPIVHISAKQDSKHWTFCVKDNGIGMDTKYQEKIFTIFQRLNTKDSYEGTGIGLAHCKKIVELHDGKIWFESKPGEGTEFYFTISKNI